VNLSSINPGITGKGVLVSVMDDGLEFTHEDIKDNYVRVEVNLSFFLLFAANLIWPFFVFAFSLVLFTASQEPAGSYDFNTNQKDPKPVYSIDKHGTRCAGEIAAVRNNVCGVGVAFDSRISAIRILGDPITDADEAAAINFRMDINQIYSCSWGPDDDGKTVMAPEHLAGVALAKGIETGRGGLGSLFVFASGNGGHHGDDCNYDGYANSVYTIAIGGVDKFDKSPYYAEPCAAQLAVTYSGSQQGDSIVSSNCNLESFWWWVGVQNLSLQSSDLFVPWSTVAFGWWHNRQQRTCMEAAQAVIPARLQLLRWLPGCWRWSCL
jgi:kexin